MIKKNNKAIGSFDLYAVTCDFCNTIIAEEYASDRDALIEDLDEIYTWPDGTIEVRCRDCERK